MIRKTLAALATAALLSSGMAPAQAGDGQYFTEECINYDGQWRTCWGVGWDRQPDGDGIEIERFKVRTPNVPPGFCSSGSYQDVNGRLVNPNSGNVDRIWDFGNEPSCHFTKDVYESGSDKGGMIMYFWITKGCNKLRWKVTVYGGGTADWHYSQHEEVVGSCTDPWD